MDPDLNEINLDNVLGTGENTDRKPVTTETKPEVINSGGGDDKSTEIKPDAPKDTSNEESDKGNEGGDGEDVGELFSTFQAANVGNLSEENKQLRQDLLNTFKGDTFDLNGNIIDEKGDIIKSKEDLVAYASEEEDTPFINELLEDFDYEFVDETGNPKSYEDSKEGIKEFIKDTTIHQLEEFKSRFFNQNPELAEISKHLLSGGKLEDFRQPIDYSKIDVSTLNESQKLQKIRESLEVKKVADEQIQSYLDLVKGSNTVDGEVAKALKVLTEYDKTISEDRDRKYEETVRQNNERMEKHWSTVETTINEGKLGDIEIPKEDRKAFNDYVSLAVNDEGQSQDMIDRAQEGIDKSLIASYYRYKGYNFDKLVSSKVKQDKVQSLRERIKRSDSIKATPINDTSKSKTSGGKEVSIDTLLP